MAKGMRDLVDRAKKDRNFLYELLADPAAATREYDLTEEQRRAMNASTIGLLGSLVNAGLLVAGCGSSSTTCPQTCAATCAATWLDVIGEELVRPF